MKRVILLLVAIIFIEISTLPAWAQWVPITARVREVDIATSSDGAVIRKESRTGLFFRASDGSTLTQWIDPSTDKPLAGDLLLDGRGYYRINYQTCKAIQLRELTKPLPIPDRMYGAQDNGQMVAGIPCQTIPHLLNHNKNRPIGYGCWSQQYALQLMEDDTIVVPSGKATTHHVRQLSDVKIGQEPLQSLFDLTKFDMSSSPRSFCKQ
jgi:hypothetical protein